MYRVCSRIYKFCLQPGYSRIIRIPLYSTEAPNPSTSGTARESLYKRISPVGNPADSVVPVLNQWIEEGRTISKRELDEMVKQLREYRRYKHALEVVLEAPNPSEVSDFFKEMCNGRVTNKASYF